MSVRTRLVSILILMSSLAAMTQEQGEMIKFVRVHDTQGGYSDYAIAADITITITPDELLVSGEGANAAYAICDVRKFHYFDGYASSAASPGATDCCIRLLAGTIRITAAGGDNCARIYSSAGTVVRNIRFSGSCDIGLSDIRTGFYIIKVNDADALKFRIL